MTPPATANTATIDVEATAWARSKFVRPRRRWRLAYSSVAAMIRTLDVLLVIATSLVTGTVYSHIVNEIGADLVRYAMTGIVIGAMFFLLCRDRGLYDPKALVNRTLQARNIIILWAAAFSLFAGAVFAFKVGHEFSRGAVLSFGFAGLLVLLGHHALWGVVIRAALKNGSLRRRNSILLSMREYPGKAAIDRNVADDLLGYGFQIEHFFQFDERAPTEIIDQVIAIARGSDIEEIFFAADLQRWKEIGHLVQRLSVLPIPLTLLPDECTATLLQRPFRRFGMTVGVEFQRPPLTSTERFLKRLLDVVCSAIGIIVLMPMLVIIALAIKIDSPGPALFMQTRHGFNSKRFRILKFRTMTVQEDGATVKQAVRGDNRVTRLGMWLRKTSIDELPQLFNVLIGDMSIVGPRPHATAHDNYYADLISDYAFRHHVKPGITGWAQVHGCRGETPTVQSMKERVDFDIWYVDNWSLLLDVQIMLRTAVEVIRGRNAY
jgi:Undecaprenyl-phosphate glucose phosphotransferase